MNKATPRAILTAEQLQLIKNDLPSQEQAEKYFKIFPINKEIYSVEPKVTATEELQQSIALDLECEDKAIGKILGE